MPTPRSPFLQSRGILARQMGGYGLPQHLRITIGTGEEMETVAAALAEFMGRAMSDRCSTGSR